MSPSEDVKPAQSPVQSPKMDTETDSASLTPEEKSIEARNRGNDLYRKGLFSEAIKAYFEAKSLNPHNAAPLSNLSAVFFELGNYATSKMFAGRALGLLQSDDDSSPKKQRLRSRIARTHVLQLRVPTLSILASSDTVHDSAMINHGVRHESVTWTRLLDEIPRYRTIL
jgi:tetratricopeptide (TPR) repeat protein